MNRREFITLAGATAAFPRVARAQQATKVPHIVVVGLATTAATFQILTQALADAGYIDGKTASIEFFNPQTAAETDANVDQALARKPDLIITFSTPAPLALKARGT